MDEQPLLIAASARMTHAATVLAAVGTGVMAGVFFAFSTSVMKALAKLPAPQAIGAMQAMNVAIVNPLFVLLLLGSTLSCLGLLVSAPFAGLPHTGLRVAGSLVFLIGAIGVTAVVNIGMNNALAVVDANSAAGAHTWADYLSRWTLFNHVRTACSVLATIVLVLALTDRR